MNRQQREARGRKASAKRRAMRKAKATIGRTPTIEPLVQTQRQADAACVKPKRKRDGKRRGSMTANRSADATYMF